MWKYYRNTFFQWQESARTTQNGNGKIDSWPFFFLAKVEKSTKFLFCCFAEAKFSAWNLFKLASYGMFGFARPDLDGKIS